ncbi:MAG: bifunctional folylpolyglutamate synthase/dihydrofolate synthase [Desulfamplus sp.]|nr:bifunctional folylpolyglutamate synthase/dihydrofolate synthase [Desulfamplus sp.]
METISYAECLKEMFALGRFGIKLELETIADILKKLGEPEKKFQSIHIAGTNGKGSIASYIASILSCSGFKVGLYTSPHLIKFNERFCINGNMVSNEDVVEAYLAVKQADIGERKATFFEISTAMAFYLFAKENVEWAVIETGMGGRLDATNVLKPEVTVISNLSMEHTEYLGDTLEKIAAEKGGIIKYNTPLVTGVAQESAIEVLKNIAQKESSPIYIYGNDFTAIKSCEVELGTKFTYNGMGVVWENMETQLLGEHQVQNSAIALAVCELLMNKQNQQTNKDIHIIDKNKRLTQESIRKGLSLTKWAGRLEYILKKPLVIIDGAHNLDAAENLSKYLAKQHSLTATNNPSKLTMIIGILNDKPYKEMLKYLLPVADQIIFTRANIDRSLDPIVLEEFAITIGSVKTKVIENVDNAVEYAIKNATENACICIAGSLYVAGEAREKILKDFI